MEFGGNGVSEPEQIGPSELSALVLGYVLASGLMLPLAPEAMKDAWLAVLLAGSISCAMAWLYVSLSLRFPNLSLVGFSKLLLGRWLGGLIGLLFLFYALYLGALTLRDFGDFMLSTILAGTPLAVPVVMVMLLAVYAARHGLETLARTGQVLAAIAVLQILTTSVMVLNQARPDNLLPVMEHGLAPILRGAVTLTVVPFGEMFLFLLLFQNVRPTKRIRRSTLSAMALSTLLLTGVTILDIAVLGPEGVATDWFPSLGTVRTIDIADFLTRLDAVVITTWMATGFVKIAVCLLIAARGLGEWTGLNEYRPLVLPLGTLMAGIAMVGYENVSHMARFIHEVWPVFSLPFQVMVPLVLLGIAWVRSMGRGTGL